MARFPLLALLLAAILLAAFAGAAPARADNPYGVMMFPNPGEDFALVLARARGLGVAWYRPPTVSVPQWRIGEPCPLCAAYARSGLKLAVTIRNIADPFAREPSTMPDDLAAFGKKIASIVATMRPALLVVESEENAPRSYSGGPDPYLAELTAACAIAHAAHIQCANGGLTGEAAAALAWLGYLDNRQPERACDFAKRALPGEDLCGITAPAKLVLELRDHLFGDAAVLVDRYKSAPIDFVNFHWLGADSRAFAETADFLARATGKPAITNEFGQRKGAADPAGVRPLLRAVIAENMPLAIWYSVDTAATDSLFGKDGMLRPTGWEFQRQLSGLR